MKPLTSLRYNQYYVDTHLFSLLPKTEGDEYKEFATLPFSCIEPFIQYGTGIKINGMNQAFISQVKEKVPGALKHIELLISPFVLTALLRIYGRNEAESLITLAVAYCLYCWFDESEIKDAMLLSYWQLSPGPLLVSLKRKEKFESGQHDQALRDYRLRHNLSRQQYDYFCTKLTLHGTGHYLSLLNPHTYLYYAHAMDVFHYYLYKDKRRAGEIAMLYFPYDVIQAVLRA